MSEQKRLEFSDQLDDKSELVDKEIVIKSVGDEQEGDMGGTYAIAEIECDGKHKVISLGSVMLKQFRAWKDVAARDGFDPLPAKAKITRPKGKRYYSFLYIEK